MVSALERAAAAALESSSVRARVDARAEAVLARAQRLALAAGAYEMAKELRIVRGVRPGSKSPTGIERPYSRVVAELSPEQRAADAGAKLTHRQIMRRAFRG